MPDEREGLCTNIRRVERPTHHDGDLIWDLNLPDTSFIVVHNLFPESSAKDRVHERLLEFTEPKEGSRCTGVELQTLPVRCPPERGKEETTLRVSKGFTG